MVALVTFSICRAGGGPGGAGGGRVGGCQPRLGGLGAPLTCRSLRVPPGQGSIPQPPVQGGLDLWEQESGDYAARV